MNKIPITELSIADRAQLVKLFFNRIYSILEIQCNGYVILFIEGIDEIYIKILSHFDELLNSNGFEELRHERPNSLPDSLHELGNEADIEWEFISKDLIAFKGKIIRFCLGVNARENDELENIIFENVDKSVQSFRKIIQEESHKAMKGIENTADKIKSSILHEEQDINEVLFQNTILISDRAYLQYIFNQINGCYKNGFYDACAVMIRRMIETLLIECYETKGIDGEIKDNSGEFIKLDKIITQFLSKDNWNISRDSKKILRELPKVKGIGDLSAHNRRFTANKNDIDKITHEVRIIIEELSTIAYQ